MYPYCVILFNNEKHPKLQDCNLNMANYQNNGRPRMSDLKRVVQIMTLDPRTVALARQLAHENNMSIGRVFEKALLHCEEIPELSALNHLVPASEEQK